MPKIVFLIIFIGSAFDFIEQQRATHNKNDTWPTAGYDKSKKILQARKKIRILPERYDLNRPLVPWLSEQWLHHWLNQHWSQCINPRQSRFPKVKLSVAQNQTTIKLSLLDNIYRGLWFHEWANTLNSAPERQNDAMRNSAPLVMYWQLLRLLCLLRLCTCMELLTALGSFIEGADHHVAQTLDFVSHLCPGCKLEMHRNKSVHVFSRNRYGIQTYHYYNYYRSQ